MAAVVVAVAVVGGLGTYALNRATPELQNRPEPAPQYKHVKAIGSKIAKNDPHDHDPPKPAPWPRVVISEIRAVPGSDCRSVLFVPSAAVRHAVSLLDDTSFTPSRLEDKLCGIAIKPVVATDRFTVEGDLVAASLAPTIGPDGATTYLLRANRQQNIVYQIQVSGETESGQLRTDVIRHAIIR
jgi:hypothetical protein